MMRFIKENKALLIILLMYLLYSVAFIFAYSFEAGGTRYYTLFDDAMISMRYAKHFASGAGLVWNIGEAPIEGYSNLLWVMIMSLFHLLGIALPKISLAVQLTATVLCTFNIVFIYKITLLLKPDSKNSAIAAALISSFYLPFNFWSLMGMEVSILAAFISFNVWLTLKNYKQGKFSALQLILPAFAYLIRMDAALLFFVFHAFNLIFYPDKKRKILIHGLISFLIIVLGLSIFRYIYYGELLPNTYYLKMTGYPILLRLGRGIFVTLKFIFPIFILIALALELLYRNRKRKDYLFLASLIGIQILYSIWIGGDSWEWWGGANRFLSITIPLLFVLTAISIEEISLKICSRYPKIGKYTSYVMLVITIISIFWFNSFKHTSSVKEFLLMKQNFALNENRNCVNVALAIKPFIYPDTKVLVNTAGVIPYFLECNIIDLLGKNDSHISKIPMRVSDGYRKYFDFNPGHLKWDYAYSIGVLKPDLIVHLWKKPEEAQAYLIKDYKTIKLGNYTFWIKINSNKLKPEIFKYIQ